MKRTASTHPHARATPACEAQALLRAAARHGAGGAARAALGITVAGNSAVATMTQVMVRSA